MKPVITLQGYKIIKLLRERIEKTDKLDKEEKPFNMKVAYKLVENNQLAFLKLETKLYINEAKYEVILEGAFNVEDSSLTEEQIKQFVKVNGTAILYPYIRSNISVISALDSQDSVLMPTLNTNIFRENDTI
ncbi:hypothetical protein A5821_001167 [Enterococcus sp. 7F3_DIV0205]|uniref:Preprotein translocase subunit SecB n=1 Tax=Candidatus Enterococcus palustris TaxID=1834189 RepID=A0AAQ3W7F3_9ENTE|nr:protein-export chaperone SecB [Enterococcus sp. 7F3_DIV0205]OTN85564.1 hypothetical protein A5821_001510 [Enterococcus sp. 7F3_DIV0205]